MTDKPTPDSDVTNESILDESVDNKVQIGCAIILVKLKDGFLVQKILTWKIGDGSLPSQLFDASVLEFAIDKTQRFYGKLTAKIAADPYYVPVGYTQENLETLIESLESGLEAMIIEQNVIKQIEDAADLFGRMFDSMAEFGLLDDEDDTDDVPPYSKYFDDY